MFESYFTLSVKAAINNLEATNKVILLPGTLVTAANTGSHTL